MPPENARETALRLLSVRASDATICPSEVARALARQDAAKDEAPEWRTLMPQVHAAIDLLVSQGKIVLSWKGKALPVRTGPYRIGRGNPRSDG